MRTFKPGDRVKYREKRAVVIKSGGGRTLIQLDTLGDRQAKDGGRRWIKSYRLMLDLSRTTL